MELDKCLEKRFSCRKYKKKKPDINDVSDILDYARLAPSAGNIQIVRFILVQDKDKIKQLAEASQQAFLKQVSYIIAVVTDPSLMKKSFDERGERYCRHQAGAVIENLLLKITDLGLASCWIGHFSDEQVKEILQIPEDCIVEELVPIGYAMKQGKHKRKQPLDSCLFFEEWKNKFMDKKEMPEAM